jgi:hypothetical protein
VCCLPSLKYVVYRPNALYRLETGGAIHLLNPMRLRGVVLRHRQANVLLYFTCSPAKPDFPHCCHNACRVQLYTGKKHKIKMTYGNVTLQQLICLYTKLRPPLWSSGQSSCLQIQRSGFDSRRYQIV